MQKIKEPIGFVRLESGAENEKLPEFFACGECGHLYGSNHFNHTNNQAIVRSIYENALNCIYCQDKEFLDDHNYNKNQEQYKERLISKANIVNNLTYCFSDCGDSFYSNVNEASEAGETGVFGASFSPYYLCPDETVAGILEQHHDEADEDDLQGLKELIDSIKIFNSKQNLGSYMIDTTVWQKIPQQKTFAMIKPDATKRSLENKIVKDIENAGFKIIQTKRKTLTVKEAEWLYKEHRHKPHFRDLIDYTISGDVVLMEIEGPYDNVPIEFRKFMGATNYLEAEAGTLRAKYALSYRENSIHGSDSPKSAIDEILYFMNN